MPPTPLTGLQERQPFPCRGSQAREYPADEAVPGRVGRVSPGSRAP